MKIISLLSLAYFFSLPLFGFVDLQKTATGFELTTLYGTTTITEPVLIDLIQSPAFERLKHIHQYGVSRFIENTHQPTYTRYQHSLGVFFVTRLYGAPLEEQIDALLHDVSHTVFSHVGDVVFKSNYRNGLKSYQDEIHEWYLCKTGIADILRVHGYTIEAVITRGKEKHFCFDQPLPSLCADRIEYNLTGGFIDNYLTREDIQMIIRALHFADGQWYFDTIDAAKKFAAVALQLTERRWGSAHSAFIDHSAAQALLRACELQIITKDDIHFSTDDVVWSKLCSVNDAHIAQQIRYIQHCHACIKGGTDQSHDLYVVGKFSGTNPWVKTATGLVSLSELDFEYAQEFERVKKAVKGGWYIAYSTPEKLA